MHSLRKEKREKRTRQGRWVVGGRWGKEFAKALTQRGKRIKNRNRWGKGGGRAFQVGEGIKRGGKKAPS